MEAERRSRKPYSRDVSDGEWAFVAPSLTLMTEQVPQRRHDRREVCNALRGIVPTGAPWRYLPGNVPPWAAVLQQTRRWIAAGVFAAMVHDLRGLVRWRQDRPDEPTAVLCDAATRQSTPESGHRAGDDGHKRRRGSKLHLAVDTRGHLLALHVTPADVQERSQVGALAAAVQAVTGATVDVAFVDEGYSGERAADAAATHGMQLAVVTLPAATRGVVLRPRRWVVESSFARATRFRHLANDDERLPETVAGLHLLAFACLLLRQRLTLAAGSP